MFQVLTINIAFEIFGLFFCLICIIISVLSPSGTGGYAAALDDIRNLFICDALVMLSDALAGVFRGKEGTLAYWVTHITNFTLFVFNYMLFGLVIDLVTHMIPSEYGSKFRRIAWSFVGSDLLIMIWNLFSGKIYHFNEYGMYTRGEWFQLSQIAGLACVIVGLSYVPAEYPAAGHYSVFRVCGSVHDCPADADICLRHSMAEYCRAVRTRHHFYI